MIFSTKTNIGDRDMNNTSVHLDNFFNETESLAATGNRSEAGKLLQGLIDNQDLTIARAHNDSGVIAWQEGKADKALEHYRQAVKLAPGNPVYRKNLADILYFGMGEIENALVHYRQIIADNPMDFDATLAIGRICADLSRHFQKEASDFLDLADRIEPGNEFVKGERKKLSGIIDDQKSPPSQPAASLNFNLNINKANPGDPETTYQSLAADLNPENNDANENIIKDFLNQFPDFALAHNDLGVISYQLEKPDQAEACYLKAVALAPQNITFRKNLADFIFIVKQEPEAAMIHYHEVLKTAPKDIETLMMIGNICLALNSEDEARNFFNLILDIEPWNLDASKALEMLDEKR